MCLYALEYVAKRIVVYCRHWSLGVAGRHSFRSQGSRHTHAHMDLGSLLARGIRVLLKISKYWISKHWKERAMSLAIGPHCPLASAPNRGVQMCSRSLHQHQQTLHRRNIITQHRASTTELRNSITHLSLQFPL
jgi:hypothetical protein